MTNTTVEFRHPFFVEGVAQVQRAGKYIVDAEEDLAEVFSFPVWQRLSTVMRLTRLGATEHVAIDPRSLGKALERDEAEQDAGAQAPMIAAPHVLKR
jgi:hypothetical protein